MRRTTHVGVSLELLEHVGVLVEAREGFGQTGGEHHDTRGRHPLRLHELTQLLPERMIDTELGMTKR